MDTAVVGPSNGLKIPNLLIGIWTMDTAVVGPSNGLKIPTLLIGLWTMDTAVMGPSNGLKIKLVERSFMDTQSDISDVHSEAKGYVVLLI